MSMGGNGLLTAVESDPCMIGENASRCGWESGGPLWIDVGEMNLIVYRGTSVRSTALDAFLELIVASMVETNVLVDVGFGVVGDGLKCLAGSGGGMNIMWLRHYGGGCSVGYGRERNEGTRGVAKRVTELLGVCGVVVEGREVGVGVGGRRD
jgi:hypothetical protein